MKKLSKILLLATLTVLLVSALVFSVNAATYTIDSAADFKTYLYDSSLWGGNHTYNITIDSIALTGTQTPIGNNSTPFKGTINGDADGDGVACTISGINVSTSTAYTGFFGAAANSTFNDLILKGSVKSTYKGGASEYNGIVGGLLGRSRGNLNVKNVDSHLTVTSSGSAVGGIVGQVCMNTSGCAIRIEASTNQGAITGFKHVGGIVGRIGGADATHSLKGTVTIHNCKNTAAITGTEAAVGGILGYFDYRNTTDLGTLNVTYCSNIGAIKGSNHVGGIIGLYLATTQKYNAALKMKVLHNRGAIDSTASSSYRGAIVGCIYVPILDATTNAPANMFTLEDWQHVGLDTEEALVGIIGKPGDGQNAAEITISRAYNMVGTQILYSKTTISGTVAFNSNNVTLNTCRNVNSSASSMASLDSASDLWKTNTATGVVTLDYYGHASHTYSGGICTFCLACNSTHGSDDRVWKYNSTTKKYYVACENCGENYIEQVTPPIVYVGTGGSDSAYGNTRATRVLTLKEAASRLVNTGGTIAITGTLGISENIILPDWGSNTITFTSDNEDDTYHDANGAVKAGFLIKTMDAELVMGGKAIFDDILFSANDTENYRIIISANWNNIDMRYVRSTNGATCYLLAGLYGESAGSATLSSTISTKINVDGPALANTSKSRGFFYERIYLGSAFATDCPDGTTISNKTVTLNVQDGYINAKTTERTQAALIYFIYTMSTSEILEDVYTENCKSYVNLFDNTGVHAFGSGFRNVGEAGTDDVINSSGVMETMTFTDGNAHLDYLNVHFNDNSNIVDSYDYGTPDDTSDDIIFENSGRFFVRNVEKTIIYVSDEDGVDEYSGEGTRTEPLIHRMFFIKNGTFESNTTATVSANYGRHGFLASFGDDVIIEQGLAGDNNANEYIVTESIGAECVWNDGVITTAPTPTKAGVMTYTCTICGRTKNASVYHEHAYVVKEDGTYYCYDFTNNKVWAECSLTAPTASVVIAATPVTHCKTVTLDVTLTATKAIAASEFKVSAPTGFVLKSADVKLSATESGTGLTATTSGSTTMPYRVVLVRNPASDATVAKTVVVTLTFDVSAVTPGDGKAHVVRVYDAASYTTAETEVATTAVSAEVTVAHKSAVTPAVAPTCTTTGLTEGEHCSVCSEVLVAQEEIPATDHEGNTNFTWEYSIEDGYHIHCSICAGILEAKEAVATVGLGLTLLSDYELEYLVPVDSDVSECWMLIQMTDVSGNVTEELVEPNVVAGTNRFATSGIAAKNMNDKIVGTYYFVKDNVLYKAASKSYNLVTYYNFAVKNSASVVRGEILVDLLASMLNYGAAAQTYFAYNAVDGDSTYQGLATKHLPADKIVDYTTFDVEAQDATVIGALENFHLFSADSQYATLNQRISMTLVFKAVNGNTAVDTSELVFKAAYKNINGFDKTIEIAGEDMVVDGDKIYVNVDVISAKDLRKEFTGALYIGEEQVSQSVTTSFECYAARIIDTDNSELEASGISNPAALKAVCKATLAYADNANNYLVYGTADELE